MPNIRQVYDSLREIDAVLNELRALALQERKDIVALDLPGLAERRTAIEKTLSLIENLNIKIAAQINSACESLGLNGEKSLSLLITVVPKPDRDMYARLQKSIRSGSLTAENELKINNALLQDSIAFTSHSLQTITGLLRSATSATYGGQGRFVDSVAQPHIICKEI